MKAEKRSHWYLWTCDREGCGQTETTHPAIDPLGMGEIPPGWIVVPPPRFWKGPSLAFCSVADHEAWARDVIGPMLLGSGS